nr:hypothetical protein Iba_chr04aCG20170 [Ipomoea batatas]
MEKLSGTSSGNPRKSLEDEDLMERSVKKNRKHKKQRLQMLQMRPWRMLRRWTRVLETPLQTLKVARFQPTRQRRLTNQRGRRLAQTSTFGSDRPKEKGGGETVRYTVQEDIPPNESDWAMEEWGDWREHPNDPPHYGALEDDMEEEYFVEYG